MPEQSNLEASALADENALLRASIAALRDRV
ncbi:MAG: hypothetical protein JWM96_1408, partial [Alphaproteobacteria bacterium]|nr:hypothetical protein [Alphaproteobacteria bacterium]